RDGRPPAPRSPRPPARQPLAERGRRGLPHLGLHHLLRRLDGPAFLPSRLRVQVAGVVLPDRGPGAAVRRLPRGETHLRGAEVAGGGPDAGQRRGARAPDPRRGVRAGALTAAITGSPGAFLRSVLPKGCYTTSRQDA